MPTLPACASSRALDLVDLRRAALASVCWLDLRIAAQRRQHLLLALELLQELGLEVGARRDVGDLEQRRAAPRGGRARSSRAAKKRDAREQVLEAHQRADAFVQRMLVANHERGTIRSAAPLCLNRADQITHFADSSCACASRASSR